MRKRAHQSPSASRKKPTLSLPVDARELAGTLHIGPDVPFDSLAQVCDEIESISSRLEMQSRLTDLLRATWACAPSNVCPLVMILLNQIAPSFENLEMGIGDALLQTALAQLLGIDAAQLKARSKASGSLADVVKETMGKVARATDIRAPLTVTEAMTRMRALAHMQGKGSQQQKVDALADLLSHASTPRSTGLLVRVIQQKLRMGLAEKGVLTCLAHSYLLFSRGLQVQKKDLDAFAKTVSLAWSRSPSVESIVTHLSRGTIDSVSLSFGIPACPMLARPTSSFRQAVDLMGDSSFTAEFKYDGERTQIHLDRVGALSIFSRNQENTTAKYAAIGPALRSALAAHVTSIVLDGEMVLRHLDGRLASFQALSSKKNKESDAFRLCFVCYDVLYLDGMALVDAPYEDRLARLSECLVANDGVQLAESRGPFSLSGLSSLTIDETCLVLSEWMDQAVAAGCEGLMLKTLGSVYESKRSSKWLKLKKDYLDGAGDSLDLVVCGAWLGKGKRSAQFGSFLVACYNEDTEDFETVARIGTGLSEELLDDLHKSLNEGGLVRQEKPLAVQSTRHMEPDVWIEPVHVWEIKCADLTLSKVHRGARGQVRDNVDKGVALRFPRLVRTRPDKRNVDATTSVQLAAMYMAQSAVAPRPVGDSDDE